MKNITILSAKNADGRLLTVRVVQTLTARALQVGFVSAGKLTGEWNTIARSDGHSKTWKSLIGGAKQPDRMAPITKTLELNGFGPNK